MGIKEKLPLINSDKKGTRIAGYIIYAFIFLNVLAVFGNMVGPDDTTTDTTEASQVTNEKSEKVTPTTTEEYDDYEWTLSASETGRLLQTKSQVISEEFTNMELDAAERDVTELRQDIKEALDVSRDYTVSSKLISMKDEYEAGLKDYISGYDGMLKAIDIIYTDSERALELTRSATADMQNGVVHINKVTEKANAFLAATE